jgi:hypothetical protein
MAYDVDDLCDKLNALPKNIQRWLRVDRQAVMDEIVQRVLNEYAKVDSPEIRESVNTGLDFLRLLNSEGGDNGLWQVTMDQIDSDIFSAVCALDADQQVALLLPWVDDLDFLATDSDASEWASVLSQSLTHEWAPVLRNLVMSRASDLEK